MTPFDDELNEVRYNLDQLLASANLALRRSKEMHELHPEAGNEKYIEIDRRNALLIKDCIDALSMIKHYPDDEE